MTTTTAAPAPSPDEGPKGRRRNSSHNHSFMRKNTRGRRAQAPRCDRDTIDLYRRRFPSDNRGELRTTARKGTRRETLEALSLAKLGPGGLGCEPYLCRAAGRWLLASTKTKASAATYLSEFRRWVRWSGYRSLSAQIKQTTRQVVADYITDMEAEGLCSRTADTSLGVLRSWVGWLDGVELWGERANPFPRSVARMVKIDQMRVQKGDGTRQSFTAEEARAVMTYAHGRRPAEAVSLALLLTTGCRGNELATAQLRAFTQDRESGRWTWTIHGKGNKTRKVEIEPAAVPFLLRYLEHRGRRRPAAPFLCLATGRGYSTRAIQHWAKAAARAVGRPEITTHDYRKTHATLLMERGARLEEAQRRLGHSNPDLTLRCYTTRHREIRTTTGLEAPADDGATDDH